MFNSERFWVVLARNLYLNFFLSQLCFLYNFLENTYLASCMSWFIMNISIFVRFDCRWPPFMFVGLP